MDADVLVDSNVFINLINTRRDPGPILSEWADGRTLAICGVVRLEVLRGVRSLKIRRAVSELMDAMIDVPTAPHIWQIATNLAWKHDRNGFVVSVADAVIAASAMSVGAAVLTADHHFRRLEDVAIIIPPPEWLGS
jgi:predicted nucleic acid-binding protein